MALLRYAAGGFAAHWLAAGKSLQQGYVSLEKQTGQIFLLSPGG